MRKKGFTLIDPRSKSGVTSHHKGFTLIELLVVIAIIAMLLAILMPALSKVKKIAMRVVCATNLKGLGTAQTVYANDYDDDYTVQGKGKIQDWNFFTQAWQDKSKVWADNQAITVGASLYLLVREADVSPKSFVCPSGNQQEFTGKNDFNLDIVELWDFGNPNYVSSEGSGKSVSYSYQQPYGTNGKKSRYAADGTRSAAFAVMADRNPYMDDKISIVGNSITEDTWIDGVHALGDYWTTPTPPVSSTSDWRIKRNNAQPHDRDSQNVLFADGHISNEKTVDVGVKNDNIYDPRPTGAATETQIRQGNYTIMGATPFAAAKNLTIQPTSSEDSYLVNDPLE